MAKFLTSEFVFSDNVSIPKIDKKTGVLSFKEKQFKFSKYELVLEKQLGITTQQAVAQLTLDAQIKLYRETRKLLTDRLRKFNGKGLNSTALKEFENYKAINLSSKKYKNILLANDGEKLGDLIVTHLRILNNETSVFQVQNQKDLSKIAKFQMKHPETSSYSRERMHALFDRLGEIGTLYTDPKSQMYEENMIKTVIEEEREETEGSNDYYGDALDNLTKIDNDNIMLIGDDYE